MLVQAGPGSGKTFVIAERIRYLIEEKNVAPEHILTITFTKAAAEEMKNRCRKRCPRADRAVFGTFHSVFYHILRTSEKYQNFSVLKEYEKKEIMKRLLPKGDKTTQQHISACEIMLRKISRYKNNWPDEPEEDELKELFQRYTKVCREQRKLDYDDMLVCCHEMLTGDLKEQKRWQSRFDYVLVDEFQDVNGRQYELVKLLSEKNQNLFVVGDDDQAIYSFRGSNPLYMKQFLEDFPLCRQVKLEENFRSGEHIVTLAGRCISNNRNRLKKTIRAVSGIGDEVLIKGFEDEIKELEYIGQRVKEEGDRAVLVRTNRQAEMAAEIFYKMKIPYSMREKSRCFYENPYVHDIMAALRFAVLGQKRGDFMAFMNKPFRGITRDMLKEETIDLKSLGGIMRDMGMKEEACEIERMERFAALIKEMDAYGAVMLVYQGFRYKEYMDGMTEDGELKKEDLDNLIRELSERAKQFSGVKKFLSFADEYIRKKASANSSSDSCREKTEISENAEPGKVIENPLQIMTYHASKGLEFETVFLPMLCNGLVPHGHMLTPEQMEEERRMFYVAMTRAKRELVLSWHGKEEEMSVFVKEILLSDLDLKKNHTDCTMK